MSGVKELLSDFNNLTLEGKFKIREEDLEAIERIIDERERIIEEIESQNYTNEEFINICEELNLIGNNEVFKLLIEGKRDYIKKKIEELNANKKANRGYNQSFYSKSIVFTKKI